MAKLKRAPLLRSLNELVVDQHESDLQGNLGVPRWRHNVNHVCKESHMKDHRNMEPCSHFNTM